MIWLVRYFLGWLIGAVRSREDLVLENPALRQQLLTLHAKRPRPRLGVLDRLFWVVLRRSWSGWRRSLILVAPETVVRWHRTGFRLYWSWISRARHAVGRKPISREVRELVFRMVAENPTWGAPRTHEELLKLGFDISERAVSRRVKRANHNPDPARRWLSVLREPSQSNSCNGFLRRADFDLRSSVLLLRHQPRRPEDSALQRDLSAERLEDRTAAREAWSATLLIEHLV
jgi:putative transposase